MIQGETKNNHEKGGIREMLFLALPMMVSFACDTIMIFTDRVFLSRLSPDKMNAAMGGGLTSFMTITFFVGLIGYATSLTAQYYGGKEKHHCSLVISQALLIAFGAYPAVLLFRPLVHSWFRSMGISYEQLTLQIVYFDILLYGSVIILVRHTLASFFSGIGRTSVVMKAAFVSMVINIVFNYVLIFGKLGMPALGIRGAAYGTIFGNLSGLILLVFSYLERNTILEYKIQDSFVLRKDIMSRLLKFGYPAGLEMTINFLAFNTMVLVFHSHSIVTATASTIMFNWDMVSFVPLLGIQIGVTSLVGRYMGAGSPDIAHKSVMSGMKLAMAYSSIIFVLFVCFPHMLVGVFRPASSDEIYVKAIPSAIFMIRLGALYVFVDAMVVVLVGALRGAGDTLWAMYLTTTLHWILAIV
ncbi:MAG: MATE family efflux transporter, partial [Thermodesulfobacteriota bacterium]|nr:MATE family efflux transporter [Thermodesulfobacteriota bacterium]